MTNRALVADPTHPVTMREAEVPEPTADSRHVVIEVHHASLNHGDLNDATSGRISPGGVLGSDVAGIVTQAATNGSGPAVGARVVALAVGGFAERVAVDVDSVAVVPNGVQLSVASGLPVAGLAALRTLRASGSVLGRRVLVTGASGGVGSFAIQLAAASGAYVVASVGSVDRGENLRDLGASEVVVALEGVVDPVDVVIDSVGGSLLARAWTLLAQGGILQSVGWTSEEQAVLEPYATVGPGKTLSSYLTVGPVGSDLQVLVDLVADGVLSVPVGWQGEWGRITEATEALRGRAVSGKAILDFAGGLGVNG